MFGWYAIHSGLIVFTDGKAVTQNGDPMPFAMIITEKMVTAMCSQGEMVGESMLESFWLHPIAMYGIVS
jgi:hypothetical protein